MTLAECFTLFLILDCYSPPACTPRWAVKRKLREVEAGSRQLLSGTRLHFLLRCGCFYGYLFFFFLMPKRAGGGQ